jgi:hypothetical protein
MGAGGVVNAHDQSHVVNLHHYIRMRTRGGEGKPYFGYCSIDEGSGSSW